MSNESERRRAPRVAKRLPLRLGQANSRLVTRTENISASGAYCRVARYVEPMTKLKIRLELPGAGRGTSQVISGKGVVVRIEPPHHSPGQRSYKIAIFFNNLSDRYRGLLAAYVEQHLTI